MRIGKSLYSAEVDDSMSRNLPSLHKSEAFDDEFFMAVSQDGKHLATGGYDKSARVLDINATSNQAVVCKHNTKRSSPARKLKIYNKNKKLISSTTDL